jgi:hypothetical protein
MNRHLCNFGFVDFFSADFRRTIKEISLGNLRSARARSRGEDRPEGRITKSTTKNQNTFPGKGSFRYDFFFSPDSCSRSKTAIYRAVIADDCRLAVV